MATNKNIIHENIDLLSEILKGTYAIFYLNYFKKVLKIEKIKYYIENHMY